MKRTEKNAYRVKGISAWGVHFEKIEKSNLRQTGQDAYRVKRHMCRGEMHDRKIKKSNLRQTGQDAYREKGISA